MILADGTIGSVALTESRASLAEAGALAAAAFTAASAPGPAAISALRSFGSEASATERSITDLPSTSPSAAPLPFANIINRIVRLLGPCPAGQLIPAASLGAITQAMRATVVPAAAKH